MMRQAPVPHPHLKVSSVTGPPDTLTLGVAASPLGQLLVGQSNQQLALLEFTDHPNRDACFASVRKRWPDCKCQWLPDSSHAWASHLFTTDLFTSGLDRPIRLFGSLFQISVWNGLMKLPIAHTISYRELAASIGRPSSTRAVATAVGRNPIAILIPCHRVIRADGSLGSYRWGRERKRQLLEWEIDQCGR